MLWLNYLRQDPEAYRDLIQYLTRRQGEVLTEFVAAQTMDRVNQLKGKVEGLTELQLIVTQEERADRERAQRVATREREARGETLAPR